MRVKVWRVTYNFGTAAAQSWTQIGAAEATNGSTRRVITVATSPTTHLAPSEHYALTVTPSDGAGPGLDLDFVEGVEITISEPGPRTSVG
jgi:hypothetical protein